MVDEPKLTIDILAFPAITLILMASVIEPLRAANRISGSKLYAWRVLSMDGEAVQTTAGIPIPVEGRFAAEASRAPLFVVASYNWSDHATAKLKRSLSLSARDRPFVAGIESGTWLLAEAALLAGHRATIHWEDHEDFAARYPDIAASRERFVIDGKRMTTGGSIPTIDLMLEIIRRRQGYSLALEVARSFNYERDGGMRAALRGPEGGPGSGEVAGLSGTLDPRVETALRLMEETVAAPLSLTRIARRAGLSARHLGTLFHAALKVSPHEHYAALRLNAARRKVIETSDPFSVIAEMTGFASAAGFSRAYRAQFRESPSETRKRVRG